MLQLLRLSLAAKALESGVPRRPPRNLGLKALLQELSWWPLQRIWLYAASRHATGPSVPGALAAAFGTPMTPAAAVMAAALARVPGTAMSATAKLATPCLVYAAKELCPCAVPSEVLRRLMDRAASPGDPASQPPINATTGS